MTIAKLQVAALGLLTILIGVGTASAVTVSSPPETQSQVKAACQGPGLEYSEGTDSNGVGYSMCVNADSDAAVVCGADRKCTGTGSRQAIHDAVVTQGTLLVPKSLSEPVTGSIDAVPPPPPPPPPADEGPIE